MAAPLAVQGHREHERPGLGIVEVVESVYRGERAEERRLRIDAGVLCPRVEIAARDPEIDARESEQAAHPGTIDGVAHRDLAQLHEPAFLEGERVRAVEGATRALEPALIERNRHASAGTRHRSLDVVLSEDEVAAVAELLRLERRAEEVQRAAGAVPVLSSVADVQQPRHRDPLEAKRRPYRPGPVGVGIADDVGVGRIELRIAGPVDIEGARRRTLTLPGGVV